MARFEMTSLAFMLDWVPEPVCQTTRGKWSMSLPEMTYGAKRQIANASQQLDIVHTSSAAC